MSETKFIAELDKTPIGRYCICKFLTVKTNKHGEKRYGIYEYVPRPIFPRRDETPEYIRGRGITFSKSEIKDICKCIRANMYEKWNTDKVKADDKNNTKNTDMPIIKDGKLNAGAPIDKDDFETCCIAGPGIYYGGGLKDPVSPSDVYKELGYDSRQTLISFIGRKSPNNVKQVNLVSWHNQPIVYDIRELKYRINSRGYKELVPKLDKGISLNDAEAIALCESIEDMFPSLKARHKNNMKVLNIKYTDDKLDTLQIGLNYHECKYVLKAFGTAMEKHINREEEKRSRGCYMNEYEQERILQYLSLLTYKINNSEPLTDEEVLTCVYVLFNIGEESDDWEVRKTLTDIANEIDDAILKRNRLPNPEEIANQVKRLTMKESEFFASSAILEILYRAIYMPEQDTEEKAEIRKEINREVLDSMNLRTNTDKYISASECKADLGKQFIEDLIQALEDSSNSPFTEPPMARIKKEGLPWKI